jgi:hypothetical protein
MFKRATLRALHRLERWLELDDPYARAEASLPFDNAYPCIRSYFRRLVHDPLCRKRPHYLWGVLQGAGLAKVLDIPRIVVLEFGVAGGAGLLSLERCAEKVEAQLGVAIDVYGFDTGTGLPHSQDYRDVPYMWNEGYFSMDIAQLKSRLQRAELKLGLVQDTVPEFLSTTSAPVAFISFDLDLYTSTRDAFQLLEAPAHRLLPRTFCYFDDILGYGMCEYNGERLAIAEFNADHSDRKVAPIYGLKHFVTWQYRHAFWTDAFYMAHCFTHPLYNASAFAYHNDVIDIDGHYRSKKATEELSRTIP